MKNLFISRLALPGLMSLILLVPALARADIFTTFDVEGTAFNVSGGTLGSCAAGSPCHFSGMFQVDVTNGTHESSGLAITLPGVPSYNTLVAAGSRPGFLVALNSNFNTLDLTFTTDPTPVRWWASRAVQFSNWATATTKSAATTAAAAPHPCPNQHRLCFWLGALAG